MYHHERFPLSLLTIGGTAVGVQSSLLEAVLLPSLSTSLREGGGGGGGWGGGGGDIHHHEVS